MQAHARFSFGHGRRLAAGGLIALLTLASLPSVALAQDEEGPRTVIDARIEGLASPDDAQKTVRIDDQLTRKGYALSWIVFLALGVMAAGVMFKDARRSHLD